MAKKRIQEFVLILAIRFNPVFEYWEICLPWKKVKYCAGFRLGYGGKVEGEETIHQAASREFKEECDEDEAPEKFTYFGTLWIHNHLEDGNIEHVIIKCLSVVTEGKNMKEPADKKMGPPEWFPFTQLPLHELPPADREWIPFLINRWREKNSVPLYIEAHLGPEQKSIIGHIVIRDEHDAQARPQLSIVA